MQELMPIKSLAPGVQSVYLWRFLIKPSVLIIQASEGYMFVSRGYPSFDVCMHFMTAGAWRESPSALVSVCRGHHPDAQDVEAQVEWMMWPDFAEKRTRLL